MGVSEHAGETPQTNTMCITTVITSPFLVPNVQTDPCMLLIVIVVEVQKNGQYMKHGVKMLVIWHSDQYSDS